MRVKSKSIVLLLLLLFTILVVANPMDSSYIQATDLTGINVAVYEGVTNEQSSSLSSRTALFWMFRWMNATVEVVTAAEIRNGILYDYDIVVVPGGWAWAYFQDLGVVGVSMIRQFVEDGGAFFGVCAGAYFACDGIRWEGEYIEYSLDLYPNVGNGPIEEIAAWPNYNMTVINLNKGTEGPVLSGEPDTHAVMYYGGPYFETTGTDGVLTLAKYDVNDEAAIIAYEYGQGRIALSGPHVEWEEDSDRDEVVWENAFDDEGSEWNMMLEISLWISEGHSPTSPMTNIATTSSTQSTDPSSTRPSLEIMIGFVGILVFIATGIIVSKTRKRVF